MSLSVCKVLKKYRIKKKKSVQSNRFLNYCASRDSLYVRYADYLRVATKVKISSMAEFHQWRRQEIILRIIVSLSQQKNVFYSTVCAQTLQSCQTLCYPMDCSLQALLSMGFSSQECWSELQGPPPGDLPKPGIKPTSLTSPTLAGRFFTTSAIFTII